MSGLAKSVFANCQTVIIYLNKHTDTTQDDLGFCLTGPSELQSEIGSIFRENDLVGFSKGRKSLVDKSFDDQISVTDFSGKSYRVQQTFCKNLDRPKVRKFRLWSMHQGDRELVKGTHQVKANSLGK